MVTRSTRPFGGWVLFVFIKNEKEVLIMDLISRAKKGIVLDGAMSDELERQGVKTNNKLWTATALINELDKVYQAHWNYFAAGAELVITDTYQANVQAFIQAGYSEQEAEKFIRDAVRIAKKARDDYEQTTSQHNYVAGTVGSYGAYLADGNEYRGDYELSEQEYLAFHLPRLRQILIERPDLIALETQPKLNEPLAVLNWLKNNASNYPVYASFTLKDTTHISDGTTLEQAVSAVDKFEQVFAIGINCISPDLVTPALKEMSKYTSKPLVVYPNLGASYDPEIKQWREFNKKFDFNELTKEWYQEGARLIGGCCTTGPTEIKQISTSINHLR